MSYVPKTYIGPNPSFPSLRPNPHEEDYNGAYGRDGAPASRFMSPIEAAYAPPTPHRRNIAPADHTRACPSPDSYLDHSPCTTLLSLYQGTGGQHFGCEGDTELPAPSPTFMGPKIKSFDASGASLIYGKGIADHVRLQEKSRPPTTADPDGEEVWHRIGRQMNEKPESTWLSSQHAAGSKFRSTAWFVTIFLVVLVGGAIAYAVLHRSPPSAPRALGWANGAKEVPTFGVDPTTTANNRSISSNATSSNSLRGRSLSTRLQTRNHQSLSRLNHVLH